MVITELAYDYTLNTVNPKKKKKDKKSKLGQTLARTAPISE